MLTPRAKQLIPKARIVSFAKWTDTYNNDLLQIFQQADEQGRYLSDEDLEQIKTLFPQLSPSLAQARSLREQAPEIISQAREKVLERFPNITQAGGELYPPERAEACWRDFWHFLRCITYGIAGNSWQFTSPEGLENMRLLYEELQVPLPAMVWGLENLKKFSLELFPKEQQESLEPYFDHLIQALRQFSPN